MPARTNTYCYGERCELTVRRGSPEGVNSGTALETLSGMMMLDGHLPLADGRELVLPRVTQPEPEQRLVLEKLGWDLPPQPPPRIRSRRVSTDSNRMEKKTKYELETFSIVGMLSNGLRARPSLIHEIPATLRLRHFEEQVG